MTTIAVITGASQGIGAAIAEATAGEPETQLALIARSADKLETVAALCREKGAQATVYPCDLTNENEVKDMAAAVQSDLGTPDLLVNNAGSFVRGDLLSMDQSAFQSVMDANLTSAFLVTRAFAPTMQDRKSGTIFYMASVASTQAYPESGAYCVAKHGLLGLARALRACTRGSGLRITTLMPGATQTPSWESDKLPQERLMPASDIAKAVLEIYKLSDRSVVEEIVLRPTLGDI